VCLCAVLIRGLDMASKQALTLESGAAQEAGVIDALPYIDGITADDRHQAEELIKEEVWQVCCP